MTFLQRLQLLLHRVVLSCIDARAEQVQKEIEQNEQAIAREIARLASIPVESVSVSFPMLTNGMVVPKVEIKRPISKEQQREVDAILATFNPIPLNAGPVTGLN